MDLIEIEKLVKYYRGKSAPAVNGVDLSVAKGDFTGLLGPNGAGKSTLIAILCGLLRPSSGLLRIKGLEYGNHGNEIKHLIGLVPQEIALYTNLTLIQNLTYFGQMYGLKGQKLRDRVDFCVEMAGLNEFASQRINTYSSGMQRRANLVTGLIHQPEILILDEPTVGIDAQSRYAIFENLKKINREGTTILYATHYMEEAQQLCSRVVIIDLGQILAQGSSEELIRSHPPSTTLEQLFLELTGHTLKDCV